MSDDRVRAPAAIEGPYRPLRLARPTWWRRVLGWWVAGFGGRWR